MVEITIEDSSGTLRISFFILFLFQKHNLVIFRFKLILWNYINNNIY